MGFFKNIGKSLKGLTKAVSIKNVIKVATGNGKEVLNDIAGRVLSPHMSQEQIVSATNSDAYAIAQQKADALSKDISSRASDALAKTSAGQDLATWFSKAWFKAMWLKNKTIFIVVIVAVVSFVAWLFMRKKTGPRRR